MNIQLMITDFLSVFTHNSLTIVGLSLLFLGVFLVIPNKVSLRAKVYLTLCFALVLTTAKAFDLNVFNTSNKTYDPYYDNQYAHRHEQAKQAKQPKPPKPTRPRTQPPKGQRIKQPSYYGAGNKSYKDLPPVTSGSVFRGVKEGGYYNTKHFSILFLNKEVKGVRTRAGYTGGPLSTGKTRNIKSKSSSCTGGGCRQQAYLNNSSNESREQTLKSHERQLEFFKDNPAMVKKLTSDEWTGSYCISLDCTVGLDGFTFSFNDTHITIGGSSYELGRIRRNFVVDPTGKVTLRHD